MLGPTVRVYNMCVYGILIPLLNTNDRIINKAYPDLASRTKIRCKA